MGTDLRARVARNTQPPPAEPGSEVEQRKPATLAEQIEQKTAVFQKAMPTGMEARQLVRDAMSLIRQNPDLAKCVADTVLGGLMTFAQLGLRPGVLGHGWLIPFKARKKVGREWVDVWEAQIVIGYKGYAELIHRSGQITTMVGRIVHENDTFDLEYGIEDRLIHKPCLTGSRGAPTGYYAIIKYKSGGYVFWHMTKTEAEEWRDRYAMAKKRIYVGGKPTDDFEIVGPWRDNFDEMAVKTAFLRAQTWAPKSTDVALARAVAVDGAVRTDLDDDPDAMFAAQHPDPNVIDVEFDEPGTPDAAPDSPPPPPVAEVGIPQQQQRPAAAAKLQTEFPPVAGSGEDPLASQGVLSSIARMIGKAATYDDNTRKAIVSRMAGLPRPVTTTGELTFPEARQVLQLLSTWDDNGVLAEQLQAVADAAKPAAPVDPGKLPKPGTRAWHDAQHPRVGDSGQVEHVAIELNGDCGICEQS